MLQKHIPSSKACTSLMRQELLQQLQDIWKILPERRSQVHRDYSSFLLGTGCKAVVMDQDTAPSHSCELHLQLLTVREF